MELVIHGLAVVPEVVEVRDGETSRELFERLRGKGHEIDLAVAVLSERDKDGDIDSTVVLIEFLDEGAHVHVRHRDRHCDKIDLRVRFGKETKSRHVRVNSTVGKALEWAASEFGIIPSQRAQYRLKLPTATEYLDNDALFGELVTSPPCELAVDLVRFEQNAG